MAPAKKSKAKPKAKTAAKAVAAKPKQGNDALRNLFLAGIGLAHETNTTMHKTFNQLVKKGKIREPEVILVD